MKDFRKSCILRSGDIYSAVYCRPSENMSVGFIQRLSSRVRYFHIIASKCRSRTAFQVKSENAIKIPLLFQT